MRRLLPLLSLVLAMTVLLPSWLEAQSAASSQDDPTVQQWTVPWERTRPRDPYVAPDGRVWFVGQAGNYVAVLDPSTGGMKRYEIEEDAFPHTVVVDDQGTVWYAGNRGRHIGRLDPATGEVKRYDMPDPDARDPHTIAFDPAGDMWFTLQGSNMIGHMDKETGRVRLIDAPTDRGPRGDSGVRPYGIKLDSQGRPWIALLGTDMIATVDPATMRLRTYDLPEGSAARRLVVDSKDRIWYGDWNHGQLGMLDPVTGEVKEFDDPNGSDSGPYGMAIDEWDRIWYVNTRVTPNRFVGFDPATESFIANMPIESGAIRHMYYDRANRTIWFGTDSNTIGKAVVKPPRRGVS